MGSPPTGFSYAVQRKGQVVVIRHHANDRAEPETPAQVGDPFRHTGR